MVKMSGILDYMQLCRLCLVKDKVNVPIFDDEHDVRQISLKISVCLPVKVAKEDNLPKKICGTCLNKVNLLYRFWNTTVNAEKQLIQWLGEIGVDVSLKNSNPPPIQMSHAHPHSMQQETLVLKEEKQDPVDVKNIDSVPDGFVQPPQLVYYEQENSGTTSLKNNIALAVSLDDDNDFSDYTANKSPPRRTRGRPASKRLSTVPSVATTSTAVAEPTSESMDEEDTSDQDDRMVMQDDSDDSMEETGDRIAKEEAESEDEYDDNTDSLEPTTFVGVPSSTAAPSDADQPGPSGLSKPSPSATSAAADTGFMEYEDNNMHLKNFIKIEPFVTLVELPITGWNLGNKDLKKSMRNPISLNHNIEIKEEIVSSEEEITQPVIKHKQKNVVRKKRKDIDEDFNPNIKGTTKRKSQNSGYRNPFIYDKIKNGKEKNVGNENQKLKTKWSSLICKEDLKEKTESSEHYAGHAEDKTKLENDTLPENEVFHCDVCLKKITSEKRFEQHLLTHNDNRFNCEICKKSYKKAYYYAVHMQFHTKDETLKCHVCEYSTIDNYDLKTHIKVHESESKYKCELCGKEFFILAWFEEHKNFHSGAKPFPCDICGKQFAYTRYMNAHKRNAHPEHFIVIPTVNECQYCKKQFPHKNNLMVHMKSHTGEDTVLCDICGKRLSSNYHLKLHRRIHTGHKPYSCTVCGKGFAKKCNLTIHERVHSGEKPYVCDVCGKSFSQRSTLVIHSRYHTGSRPYVCHLCNKGFVAKGVLGIHLKSCNGHMDHYVDSLKD